MDAELDAIFAAWDKTDGGGRDDALTRSLSTTYVADHPELFATLASFGDDQDRVIKSLEVFRDAGWTEQSRLCQVWLWRTFQPQQVGGVFEAELRLPTVIESTDG